MNARSIRRAIERKARKQEARKAARDNSSTPSTPAAPAEPETSFTPSATLTSPGNAPVSEAKRAANQRNAQFSTGPKTEEGKARSCLNHFSHGLTGGTFRVLNHEDQREFDLLRESLELEHHPRTPTDLLLIKQMAQSWWLRQRAQYYQDTLLSSHGVFDQKEFALYLRYQAQHDRAFYKALRELNSLRSALRRDSSVQTTAGYRRDDQRRKQELHELNLAAAQARLDSIRARTLVRDTKAVAAQRDTLLRQSVESLVPQPSVTAEPLPAITLADFGFESPNATPPVEPALQAAA